MALSLTYFPKAGEAQIPPYKGYTDIFLGDTFSNVKNDPQKPITSGFYRIEKAASMTAIYAYHEYKFITDGDITISDATGQKVKAVRGDVVYFPKGATITFETENGGAAFYFGQRAPAA